MSDKRVSEMTDAEICEMAGAARRLVIGAAAAGPGDVEQALELRARIAYAIEQGDGDVSGDEVWPDTAKTTLHFSWMGHRYILAITDLTPEGT